MNSEVFSNLNDYVIPSIQPPEICLVRKRCALWVTAALIGVFTGELWVNSPKRWTALHRRWRWVLKSVCKCFSVRQRKNSDLGKLQMCLWWELRCSFLLPTTPSGRQEQRKEYSSNSLNPQLCQVHNPIKQVKLFLQHYPHKPPSWGCSEIPIMSCVGPGLHSPVDHYSSEHSLANYSGS